jgi:small subunit ribosomal protein S9
VRLYKGDGKQAYVNTVPAEKYFNPKNLSGKIFEPLKLVGMDKDFDISVHVLGGGSASQADAVRHGVARALVIFDLNLKTTLKKAGLLTRDSRAKERKKPGLKRARRAPQYAKR